MTRDARGRFCKKNNTENTVEKENNTMSKTMNFTQEELAQTIAMAIAMTNGTTTSIATVNNDLTVPTIATVNGWAKNSQFYGKEICGVIYNPYLFSRFVPARYLQMMQKTHTDRYNQYNVNKIIRDSFDGTYAIKVVQKEVNKMAMLEKRDSVAFEDRKWLYSIPLVKGIIKEYVEECIKYIDDAPIKRYGKKNYKNIKGRGSIPCGEIVETIEKHMVVGRIVDSAEIVALKKELTDLVSKVNRCYTYGQISNVLAGFKIIKLKSAPTKSFIEAYKRRGSYETLKYIVAFGNCSFKGKARGAESLKEVMQYVKFKEAYQLHAALKECIKDNGFDIFNPVFNER